MRIAEHLGDREDAARFESAITLRLATLMRSGISRCWEHDVEAGLRNVGASCITEDGRQVGGARLLRATLKSFDHRRLDIDPDRFAIGKHLLRGWYEQPSRAGPDLQDLLSWPICRPGRFECR